MAPKKRPRSPQVVSPNIILPPLPREYKKRSPKRPRLMMSPAPDLPISPLLPTSPTFSTSSKRARRRVPTSRRSLSQSQSPRSTRLIAFTSLQSEWMKCKHIKKVMKKTLFQTLERAPDRIEDRKSWSHQAMFRWIERRISIFTFCTHRCVSPTSLVSDLVEKDVFVLGIDLNLFFIPEPIQLLLAHEKIIEKWIKILLDKENSIEELNRCWLVKWVFKQFLSGKNIVFWLQGTVESLITNRSGELFVLQRSLPQCDFQSVETCDQCYDLIHGSACI